MTWIRRQLAMERFWSQRDWQVDVESNEMREELGLRYYLEKGDELITPEELGRRIDDCLVEYIHTYLWLLKDGNISIEEFKSRMRKIEEGMEEDPDLKAFAVTLRKKDKGPPATRTYLELARRHVRYDGKRSPSSEEGRRFALVLLDDVLNAKKWEIDWDRRVFIRVLADRWLDSRDPGALQKLIHESEKSPVAWDVLQLICQEVADGGKEDPPYELLHWHFRAAYGCTKRPGEEPALSHRPQKVGYMLRDNEIRHVVDLLVQVGMTKTAGCHAVAEAVLLSKRRTMLSEGRILQICQKPNWTIPDLTQHAMERLDPSFYSSPFEAWLQLRSLFFCLTRWQPLPAVSNHPKE